MGGLQPSSALLDTPCHPPIEDTINQNKITTSIFLFWHQMVTIPKRFEIESYILKQKTSAVFLAEKKAGGDAYRRWYEGSLFCICFSWPCSYSETNRL
jgi:hypothetical protein